jgi:DNA-binding Lrp family transcriptional regulator
LAVYGIPAGQEKAFETYLDRLRESGPVRNISFFWSTCVQTINATGAWFDKTSEEWSFPWDSWVEEVQKTQADLPYTLKEPDAYIQKADWLDIMILKELEKNSTIKLIKIARKLDTSLERVMYHFKNHVLKEGMFEGYQIVAEHYKNCCAESHFFQFYFRNLENLRKFACSLMNKPFARFMGKEYGNNRLFAQIYLPKEQLSKFMRANSKLVREGLLENYEFTTQDMAKTQRQTISFEFFKDGDWEYDNEKYVDKLRVTVEQFT